MTREFFIPCDGIRLHAKMDMPDSLSDSADAPVGNAAKCPLMILIHGFTGHMEEPHLLAVKDAANDAGAAVLRVELYGHGKSGGTFREHTLYKWVTEALTVTEYAKSLDFVTDLYLCGHSQGGLLSMLIAGMLPDVFKAVIPLSPAWKIPENARKGCLHGISFDPEHIPEEFDFGEEGSLSANYIRTARTIHPEDEIARCHGQVLIVHGAADETVPVEQAYQAAALYENCRLAIIPGDTHCFDHHADQMAEAVKTFLLELSES